jgi:phosphoribosylglycinamide formyltransferase-1
MRKVRIAVLVSGGGTNLGALINAEKDGILKSGEIVLVVSNKNDAYALTRAKENGIKTEIVLSKNKAQKDFEKQLTAILESESIELIILAGFMRILSKEFTDIYKNRIINVHPSLIPSFCGEGFYGLNVHKAALAHGAKITGATVHFVNEIPDGGEIIMQKAVEIDKDYTPEELQTKVMREAEWIILPLSAEKVCKQMLGENYYD